MFLPLRCALCDRPGRALCPACAATLRAGPEQGPVPALLRLDGAGLGLLAALKYRNARGVAGVLGPAMALLVAEAVDAVTWAPTTASRRRHRGYDQARLLAEAVADALHRPCPALLARIGRHQHQTGRSRVERLGDPPQFRSTRPPPRRVLLVDDVVTTGGTLTAAKAVLQAAGAIEVHLLAAAATPAPGLGALSFTECDRTGRSAREGSATASYDPRRSTVKGASWRSR